MMYRICQIRKKDNSKIFYIEQKRFIFWSKVTATVNDGDEECEIPLRFDSWQEAVDIFNELNAKKTIVEISYFYEAYIESIEYD